MNDLRRLDDNDGSDIDEQTKSIVEKAAQQGDLKTLRVEFLLLLFLSEKI